MKRPVIIASALTSVLLLGVASSAIGQVDWGTYQGFSKARIKIDNVQKDPSSPAIIIKGTTYVPLRFISESMGIGVDWDQANRTVLLSKNGSSTTPTTTPSQSTGEYKYPPISKTDKKVTITINNATVDTSGVTLNVTVTNGSAYDYNFAPSQIKMVVGSTQYDEPTSYEDSFIDELKPGVSKTGDIKFPGANPGSKITIYFWSYFEGSLDTVEPTFYIQG